MPETEAFTITPRDIHGRFGLERENLRIDPHGKLALTPHPFGDKQMNPEITTDFSESQIELVTPAAPTIEDMLAHEARITRSIYTGIGDELLWPLSTPPPCLPPENQIPIADFGVQGKEKTAYRMYLAKKYGRRKQLYCGIHFNVSFPAGRFPDREARNRFYLNLAAGALRSRFFLVYLLAASPEKIGCTAYRSGRLSVHGYRNTRTIRLDFSGTEAYLRSIRAAVSSGMIEGPRELYQLVRIKGRGFADCSETADADHIELRIADLNPLFQPGINPHDLYLMHLYLLWCAQQEPSEFTAAEQDEADALSDEAALLRVSADFSKKMAAVFAALHRFLHVHRLPAHYSRALHEAEARWHDPKLSYACQIQDVYADDPRAALARARQIKAACLLPLRS